MAEAESAAGESFDAGYRKSRWRRPLLLLAPVVVLIGAGYFYLSGGRYQSTENASLQTGIVGISASVSGQVTAVEVKENQLVKAGDVLFRLSSNAPQAAVAEAEAQLAAARTDIGAKQADYREALAEIEAAQAKLAFASGEAGRQRALLGDGISSRSQYEEAATAVRTAQTAIASARARAESLRAELAGSVGGGSDAQPAVRRARAMLERAQITLNDSVVRAPKDGIVTRVHQLQPGSYVTAGRPVFMLSGTKFWVQANFKESQLRYMRVGQPVTVKIDAFPDHELKGHVASFSPGTGSSFSVLPAENATGNWVKVVQRLPVEVAVDSVPAELPLHAGLSVEVEVDTGHQRHLFGADTPPYAPKVVQ